MPGPLARLDVKIHIYGASRLILDSTALVGPDSSYCAHWWTDGRRYCPPRPEGHLELFACDGMIIGKAEDTGRQGPTWYFNEQMCSLPACENHPDNQFLVFAYQKGVYKACSETGICGSLTVE